MPDASFLNLPLVLEEFGGGAGVLKDADGKHLADIHNGDMWVLEALVDFVNRVHRED